MRGLVAAVAVALLATGSLALQPLASPSPEARGLALVAGLSKASNWSERFLALSPLFEPGLTAQPFHEDRPIVSLVQTVYEHLGFPWTPENARSVESQAVLLPAPVRDALQQLLGAIELGMTDWEQATAPLTTDDWTFLAEREAAPRADMTPDLARVLAKMDSHRLRASAVRLLVAVDSVTPALQAWTPGARLNDCDLGAHVQGPNDCVWFADPYNIILVGGLGASVYRGNTVPYASIDSTEHVLILDPGGNDAYYSHAGTAHPWPAAGVCDPLVHPCGRGFPVSVSMDLQGNDHYGPEVCCGPAYGYGDAGIGLLVDAAGDDTYVTASVEFSGGGLGEGGFEGLGLLLDATGDDYYQAPSGVGAGAYRGVGVLIDVTGDDQEYGGSQGKGVWGTGIMADLGGNDIATAGWFSQGSNQRGGQGVFLNIGGSDTYTAGPASRGYSGACWDSGILPPCSLGMVPDFLGLFLDVCGTNRDTYIGAAGRDGTMWTQNTFGFGEDLNVPVVGCAAYE